MQPRPLIAIALLGAVIAAASGRAALPCGLAGDGWAIDLSPLIIPPLEKDYLTGIIRIEQYEFNICAPSNCGIADCWKNNGTVCQFGVAIPWGYVARLASWDSPEWSTIDPTGNPASGIQVKFYNGDYCPVAGGNRNTTFQFTCADTAVGNYTVREHPSTCQYVISFPTKYACLS